LREHLRLADGNNVDPHDIAPFVTDRVESLNVTKGIERRTHQQRQPVQKQDSIEALRKTALKCEPTALRKFVPEGLAAALLDL
jgi:hypothetical protein